jgi:co-chaperonin GroES (HSP10)
MGMGSYKALPKSKYLEAFEKLKTKFTDKFHLTGDCLLVESLPNLEASKEVIRADGTKVSLFMTAGDTKKIDGLELNKPTFARVIACGEGFYKDQDGDMVEVPLEVKPGDVVLISPMSVKWFSILGGIVFTKEQAIGITRESEVQMHFKGEETYDHFFHNLHQEVDHV